MRKNEKNSIDWVFNHSDARKAVTIIGARNLTIVEAVNLVSTDKEKVLNDYSKMIQHNSDQADKELRRWITKTIKEYAEQDIYVYFRFKRFN